MSDEKFKLARTRSKLQTHRSAASAVKAVKHTPSIHTQK